MAGGLLDVQDPWVMYAIAETKERFGVLVSVDTKKKSLLKFGRSVLSTSGLHETVWGNSEEHEAFVSTNIIDSFSSSDLLDTEDMVLEGYTVDGSGNFTFVEQSLTQVGQTQGVLATPLARAVRAYNNGTADLLGTTYFYEDTPIVTGVPTDKTKIHLQTEAARNHTLKGSTTMGFDEFWFISSIYAVVDQRTSAAAEFDFEIREKGKVFRSVVSGAASSDGMDFSPDVLRPFIIVPANADFRITAKPSSNSVAVEAWANGVLAKVVA